MPDGYGITQSSELNEGPSCRSTRIPIFVPSRENSTESDRVKVSGNGGVRYCCGSPVSDAGNPEAPTPTRTPEERQRLPVWRDGGRAGVLHDKLWLSTSRTDRPQVALRGWTETEVDASAIRGPERSHGIR